jgi:hypothetical protein
MIKVRLFHISAIQLAFVADHVEYDIKNVNGRGKRINELNNIASEIQKKIKTVIANRAAGESLEYPEKLINDMAALHSDTWIEEVALHTMEYSTVKDKRPEYELLDTSSTRKARNKRYSGDVSGVIGETLFSVVLRVYYEMDPYSHYSHLSQPNRMRYPDCRTSYPARHSCLYFSRDRITS